MQISSINMKQTVRDENFPICAVRMFEMEKFLCARQIKFSLFINVISELGRSGSANNVANNFPQCKLWRVTIHIQHYLSARCAILLNVVPKVNT